jgi:hypothetical protein
MKCFHYEGHVPQQVLYGPSAPIASKLTADNWQECAILRAKQYLYIGAGRWGGTGDDSLRYRVNTSPNGDLSKDFARLEEAIDYANHLGKPDKKLPFKRSSGAYVGVRFGKHREGLSIPLKEGK